MTTRRTREETERDLLEHLRVNRGIASLFSHSSRNWYDFKDILASMQERGLVEENTDGLIFYWKITEEGIKTLEEIQEGVVQ